MEPPEDQPPRGTKRPLGGADLGKASGARGYGDYGAAAYDHFVDDDGEGYGGGGSSRDDTGFLDEIGGFVESGAQGSTKEDAWLGSADADTTAPAVTKRARKALQKQEEDERLVDDLVSARAVFDLKKRMAGILEPGETVPRALRRLKGLGGGASATGGGTRGTAARRMDEATRRAFDELTDAAAELVERGDLDAYSDDREAFERAAWVYEYGRRARASASASAPEVEAEHEADTTANRSYVDMFGEDDVDDAGARTATDVGARGQAVNNPDQPAARRDASAAAVASEEEAGEGDGTGVAGWDYVYDPVSGYYYSGSTGYYYDAASGCYCSASTGTWFSYNGDDGLQYSGTPGEMQP